MPTKEAILEKLKNIIDPDFNRNIVELGFIKELEINEGSVAVTIELTTPACPVKEVFRKEAHDLITSLAGVKRVDVVMSAQKTKRRQKRDNLNLAKVDNIIGVASCKGGVGKSTVAASLACEISSRGFKVGLFDTDIFGPSLPALFNLFSANVRMKDNLIQPFEVNDNLKLMSFGFLLKEAPAIMRGAMVSNYIMELINKVEWGELDYLFIDMPPGTGDVQLTLSQNMSINGVVMVTTAHVLSVVDVIRGILMFEKVKVPIVSLVENMSYFECDSCLKKHYLFEKAKISFRERFGLASEIELPFLPRQNLSFENYQTSSHSQSLSDEVIRQIGKSNLSVEPPPRFDFDESSLKIIYPDRFYQVSHLKVRRNCGCALCKDEMTGEAKLQPQSIPANVKPLEIHPLGNYALSIHWSDGHTSGIYPYHLIKSLAE